MLNKEKLNKVIFDNLEKNEQENLLKQITIENPKFEFSHFETFIKYGIISNTAVYLFENKEFVFVPGQEVVLGWDFEANKHEKTFLELQKALEEYWEDLGLDSKLDIENFLVQNFSPKRKTFINPMLVERKTNKIGWKNIEITDEIIDEYTEEFEKIKSTKKDEKRTLYDESKTYTNITFTKNKGKITAGFFEKINLTTFKNQICESGFALPTENEWEYLRGGGKKTLFPWGNNVEVAELQDTPNHFGITIAFDPYKFELVDSECIFKGGDGGCFTCGGFGSIIANLPTATFYRGYDSENDILEYKENISGDYTCYRRIFRITNE